MKFVKASLAFLTLFPAVTLAKVRGVGSAEAEEMFPTRQLMGGMGGCPDPDDAPAILCSSNEDCVGSPFCNGNADCCCVGYTYPYCGVPSDCNQYLQCLPPSEAAQPVPFSTQGVDRAFELLSRVSSCLAEDEEESDDNGSESESKSSSSSSSSSTGKSSKRVKNPKSSGGKKKAKRNKRERHIM